LAAAKFSELVNEIKELESKSNQAALDAGLDESNMETLIQSLESIESHNIECSTQGTNPIFSGMTGQVFTVVCPSGC